MAILKGRLTMRYNFKKTGHGLTDNLGFQLQKIVKSLNEKKFSTRYRYIAAEERFLKFVAQEFRLQKITNVKDKHLEAYVKHHKLKGSSDKYIKNELCSIRFFHNINPNTKNELKDSQKFNEKVGLSSTTNIKDVDRSWTPKELKKFLKKSNELNRPEIANVLLSMRLLGLRIDEAVTLQHHHIQDALKTGNLHLHRITKGAVPRDIILTNDAKKHLETMLKDTSPGEYVYTPKQYVKNHEIHKFKKSIQNFINHHRRQIQLPNRSLTGHNVNSDMKAALTAHGLRHLYAKEKYKLYRNKGYSIEQAKVAVSKELGHHRKEITEVYLANL